MNTEIDELEDDEEEYVIALNDEDRQKLMAAQELIQSTEFWKRHAEHDYDWSLHRASSGIDDTLEGKWWG